MIISHGHVAAHALAERLEAVGPHPPRGGHQDAGEHLDGGGLAGAVRPDVADHFPRPDLEGDAVHRRHLCLGAVSEK